MEKTVLVVDANKTFVRFLGILLKRMGFGLVSAGSGREALGLVSVLQPDLIMIDSELAEFEGFETLEKLKVGGPSITPVIMLVGSQSDEAERRCILAGACTVVTKPVVMQDLHMAIQECMFRSIGLKRRHIRVRANVRVSVYHAGGELSLVTESISAGGAFIQHNTQMPVGTIVDVFMPLGEAECLFLTGRVVYNEKPCQKTFGSCPGFAVEFVDPSDEDSTALNEFVSSFIAEDIITVQEEELFRGIMTDGSHASQDGKQAGPAAYMAMRKYLNRQDRTGSTT